MASEHADDFWEAAKTEIRTLEEMDSWRVVDRTPDMNVIGGTWAFKIKRFPDGLIKKFKARFCARGISSSKESTSSRPMLLWYSGALFA